MVRCGATNRSSRKPQDVSRPRFPGRPLPCCLSRDLREKAGGGRAPRPPAADHPWRRYPAVEKTARRRDGSLLTNQGTFPLPLDTGVLFVDIGDSLVVSFVETSSAEALVGAPVEPTSRRRTCGVAPRTGGEQAGLLTNHFRRQASKARFAASRVPRPRDCGKPAGTRHDDGEENQPIDPDCGGLRPCALVPFSKRNGDGPAPDRECLTAALRGRSASTLRGNPR